MKANKTVIFACSALLLSACQPQYGNGTGNGFGGLNIDKEMIGSVLGAAGGAAAGSNIGKGRGQIAAIAIGTLLGAKLGASVGQSLDRADMSYYNKTSQNAMERGQPGKSFPWDNPQSQASGTITPQTHYQTQTGQYCREYTQSINIGGKIEKAHGTACREQDGTWKIANSNSNLTN